MGSNIAPNLSWHSWGMGIKGPDHTGLAAYLVTVRGTEFESNKEIEFEDDEGHTGTATTKMSSYRSKAESSPSFTDKCRYKCGWEDALYCLLGDYTQETVAGATDAQKYTFAVNPLLPKDPPFVTLYNGFYKTENDAYIYDDCLLNEFEINFSNEEAMTYKLGFNSNYPKFNQPNSGRMIPAKDVFIKPADVSVYIADQGTLTEENMEQYRYGCYLEGSLTVNNNNENQPCSDDEFGTSTKVIGDREADFKLSLPWTDLTKGLEYKFMGGSADATTVTHENDVREVWIKAESAVFEDVGGQEIKYSTIIKIPEIVIQVANSPQSGNEAKQLELEGKVQENAVSSFISAEVVTDLSELHIDNT
ncbi:hypothetical protein [Methanobrevibacter sp. DSM 116169]|uniref:hypothetical protein n=1 Tax=Methanobrevibacter sp. DSM 116169 TaxID=3242727 RepID=UPI0038FC4A85